MNSSWIYRIPVFLGVLTVCAVYLGGYMARVFNGEKTVLSRFFSRPENWIYKFLKIDSSTGMSWQGYAIALLVFNLLGVVFLFLLQLVQHALPLNPQGFGAVKWDLALNTAVSFVTNTNWQAYGGESTMSYLTQMLGMTVQNFLSAATGIAASIAVFRGFTSHSAKEIGNFWVDLTRSLLYILLPLSVIFAVVLGTQGVIQNFSPYVKAKTLEGQEQVIAQGPAASQTSIKMLGTNGGGFFNANSSHPYENPNPLTDWLQIMALLVISAALPFTFGAMLKTKKQGWAVFAAMMILFLLGLGAALWSESQGNPILAKLGVHRGVNMEGKEVRFGILSSVFFAQSTTVTSCGAVNSMHDSFLPLTGLVLLFNMMVGEVIFGGVGSGIIGFLLYAILAMFLVGLMIGRTPEIFGKKLEPPEMVMAVLAIVLPSVCQLSFSSVAISIKDGLAALNNAGPHGLSEIIYAFASGAGNNGSAFAGLNANTPFYNLTISVAMIIGRYITLVPALAIAGKLAAKKTSPPSARFPTASPLFVLLLVGVIIIVGALTFFPALALGPFIEHLAMNAGKTY